MEAEIVTMRKKQCVEIENVWSKKRPFCPSSHIRAVVRALINIRAAFA